MTTIPEEGEGRKKKKRNKKKPVENRIKEMD